MRSRKRPAQAVLPNGAAKRTSLRVRARETLPDHQPAETAPFQLHSASRTDLAESPGGHHRGSRTGHSGRPGAVSGAVGREAEPRPRAGDPRPGPMITAGQEALTRTEPHPQGCGWGSVGAHGICLQVSETLRAIRG